MTGFLVGDLIWIVFILGFYCAFDFTKEAVAKKVNGDQNWKRLIS
jgi:hypothetical protein